MCVEKDDETEFQSIFPPSFYCTLSISTDLLSVIQDRYQHNSASRIIWIVVFDKYSKGYYVWCQYILVHLACKQHSLNQCIWLCDSYPVYCMNIYCIYSIPIRTIRHESSQHIMHTLHILYIIIYYFNIQYCILRNTAICSYSVRLMKSYMPLSSFNTKTCLHYQVRAILVSL